MTREIMFLAVAVLVISLTMRGDDLLFDNVEKPFGDKGKSPMKRDESEAA